MRFNKLKPGQHELRNKVKEELERKILCGIY